MMTFPDKDFESLVLQEVKEYGINYSRTDIENIYIKFMYAYSYLESHFFCNQKFQLVSYEEFFPELGLSLENWHVSYTYRLGDVCFSVLLSRDIQTGESGFLMKSETCFNSRLNLFRLKIGNNKKCDALIVF